MSNSLKRNCRILVSGVLRLILENLCVSGGGLGLQIVGLSPGSTKMSNSLKRNCHFPVSGVLGVILENLGVSGGGPGMPVVGVSPAAAQGLPEPGPGPEKGKKSKKCKKSRTVVKKRQKNQPGEAKKGKKRLPTP